MNTIKINQAQAFAIANDLQQVIIFGHDGENTHVVTWGDTPERSAQAAAGANAIKKNWGWPEDTIVESEKVKALQRRLERALEMIAELRSGSQHSALSVHVIEGTEHERGWGQRPDGFVAFLTKEAAEEYITTYNKRFNNEPSVPDEYTTYAYIGLKECSPAFARLVSQKGVHHFDRKSEMLE